MEELRGYGAIPELKVAIDQNWNPIEYGDPNSMLVAKVDLTVEGVATLHCGDFKTGHVYRSHGFQAKVYTSMAQHRRVYRHTAFYLDFPLRTITWEFSEKEHARNRDEIEQLVNVIWSDTSLEPTPGKHCDGCPLHHDRGGPCTEGI